MTTRFPIICDACALLHRPLPYGTGRVWTCDSFPEGIPMEIRIGEHDHRVPLAGESLLFTLQEGREDVLDLVDMNPPDKRRRFFQ